MFLIQAGTADAAPNAWAKGRILVAPADGASAAQFTKALSGQQGRSLRKLNRLGVHVVSVPAGREAAIAKLLARHPAVKFAELDVAVALSDTTVNDTYYTSQWHLPKMGCPAAWDDAKGSGVKVAILDTGVDPDHPDLAASLLTGYNAPSGTSETADVNGHGTSVAGTVAAIGNNGTGVASVAWQAQIIPIRVTNSSDGYAYFSDIANGLTWAADNGAKVANISYDVSGSSSITSAAQYFWGKGGVTVVAAGNSGSNPGYSDNPYMISVAATTSSDVRASWSSFGSYVDVAAPGAGIYTTKNGGGYGSVSGTSFSSPATVGVVALIFSANPSLSPAQVESILEDSATDLGDTGYDIYYGYGRVNAAQAVYLALQETPAPNPDPDTQAPSVSITSPASGTTVAGSTTVGVSASDDTGVTKVELYVDGSLEATDSSAPFVFSWDTTACPEGSCSLTAKAYDAAGNVKTSTGVGVTVDNVPEQQDTTPPAVSISKPADGSTVSGNVKITATASDDVGVTSLKIYIDGALQASTTESSLTTVWNTRKVSQGSHTIKAVATDAAGNTATKTITVTVGSTSTDSKPPRDKKK